MISEGDSHLLGQLHFVKLQNSLFFGTKIIWAPILVSLSGATFFLWSLPNWLSVDRQLGVICGWLLIFARSKLSLSNVPGRMRCQLRLFTASASARLRVCGQHCPFAGLALSTKISCQCSFSNLRGLAQAGV